MSTRSPWAGFSTDPRGQAARRLRASDRDRDHASSILANAYAEGRLRTEEHSQRLDAALAADHLGDLVPIISDLVIPAPVIPGAPPTGFRSKGKLAPGSTGWSRKDPAVRAGSPHLDRSRTRVLAVALPLAIAAVVASFVVFGHFPVWLLLVLPLLIGSFALRRSTDRSPGHGGTNQLPDPNADPPHHI